MKHLSWLALSVLALALTNLAHADSTGAILRCDPAAIIYKIDGKSDGNGGHTGARFKDCSIPLSAGKHTAEVCYDLSSTSMNTMTLALCDKSRDIEFETVAGHTYRLRFEVGQPWKAWIDDVTEAEAGYSYAERPKKPKPDNKADRKTTVILQVTPANSIPHLFRGELLGPWFVPHGEAKGENTGIAKAAPDGFVVATVDAGENLTVTNVRILEGSVFNPNIFYACDNYESRVFEDLAGGKVLYLGHLQLEEKGSIVRVSWSDDIDVARKYVDAHFPKLAGKLESTPHTARRLPEPCIKYPQILVNAP
jgi:hypothetical protein